jgi:cytochrome P450
MAVIPILSSTVQGNTNPILRLGLNPFPWYQQMRSNSPVNFNEQEGTWELFRYDDMLHVLLHPTLFSSQHDIHANQELPGSILHLDPPQHRYLRQLISQAFTPWMVTQLAPQMRSLVHWLLDQKEASGRMDIIDDLAAPLPVLVTAEMLGIPLQDRDNFRQWSNALISFDPTRMTEAHAALKKYIGTLIGQRRQQPGKDLISALLAVRSGNMSLSDQDMLDFCTLLAIAGHETTTNLIGNAVLCIDEHPGLWLELRANPLLLAGAIEEVLRYLSPLQRLSRRVTANTMFHGVQIPAGSTLTLWIGSANHDERQFQQPETFQITRAPNRHLGFGHGIHMCLGASLARLAARITLECLLTRFNNIERIRSIGLRPTANYFSYGLEHLPVTISFNS